MHPKWNIRLGLLGIGMACISHGFALGAPHIESARPPAYILGASGFQYIMLVGSELAAPDTTGYTIDADVQVYMRDGWGTFQRAKTTGWLQDRAVVEFPADPWLLKAGTLEFKVVVRGVESNIFQVLVSPRPTAPPILTTVFPGSIVLDPKGDAFHYIVKVFGKNLDDSTSMSIGGVFGEYPLTAPGEGWVQAQVPVSLRSSPGRYKVQLWNRQGGSNVGVLDLTRLLGVHEERRLPQGATFVGLVSKTNESKAGMVKPGLAEKAQAPQVAILGNPALVARVVETLKAQLSALQPKIQVSAAGGLVTLTGTVPGAADKAAVEKAVTGVSGVVRVQNDLQAVAVSVIQRQVRNPHR